MLKNKKHLRIQIIITILIFTLLNNVIYSQYYPNKMIKTKSNKLYSMALSPINGHIIIGGQDNIQHYDQNGIFLQFKVNNHQAKIIQIFWTEKFLITIDKNGKIIRWDPNSLQFLNEINNNLQVFNADISQSKLALNYRNKIDQYSLQSQSQIIYTRNYTSKQLGEFNDISYSKINKKGQYLYAVTNNFKIRFRTIGPGATFYQTPSQFYTIDSHPLIEQHQVLIDKNFKIRQVDQFQDYKIFTIGDYNQQRSVKYSQNGLYVYSSFQNITLFIWQNQQVLQKVDGWQCQIVQICQNKDSLIIVDQCGNLGILKNVKDQNSIFQFILIFVIAIIVLLIFIAFICIEEKRTKKKYLQYDDNAKGEKKISLLSSVG